MQAMGHLLSSELPYMMSARHCQHVAGPSVDIQLFAGLLHPVQDHLERLSVDARPSEVLDSLFLHPREHFVLRNKGRNKQNKLVHKYLVFLRGQLKIRLDVKVGLLNEHIDAVLFAKRLV
jgi:hypothetical protein